MAKLPVDESHQVQLAMRVPINEMPLPLAGQLKYNGCRITAVITDIDVAFKTRNSHQVLYPEMLASVRALGKYNCILDGEWCKGDSRGTNHTAITGRVNSAMKTGTPIPNNLGWVFNIFDYMSLDHWNNKNCPHDYRHRYSTLQNLLAECPFNNIAIAKTWDFNNHADIEAKYNELIALGYEGMIGKAWSSLYTHKKNKTWMKLKAEEPADLLCTGWEGGKGKYTGMIGKLICEGVVEGREVKVGVGTGMTDADRARDPEYYLGNTIEIKYNEVCVDNRTGEWSLFLPVYVATRLDKS